MAADSDDPEMAAGSLGGFAVVFNDRAGALVGREDVSGAITAGFAEHGLVPILIAPDAGDLATRIALARDTGAGTIVVMGGDGTVACAAQLLAGSATRLAILPSGTMNLLARDLGIPIGDLSAAIGVLQTGVARAIDVGDVNGHLFLCGSMTGLPTRLAQMREAGRGGPVLRLWARFLGAALRVFSQYRPVHLRLLADGLRRHVRTPAMTVTVNALSDNTGRQFGRACLDGGRLGVYVFNRLRLRDALRVGLAAASGHWRGDTAVDEMHVHTLSVATRRPAMRVMNDGEAMLLQTPLIYKVRPVALWVVAPVPGTGDGA